MDELIAIVVVILFFSFISFMCGNGTASDNWQADCINRGVARYHPVTGQWEWTVPEVKKEKE